ncbi:putative ABC transport system permease protein [Roseimicrobium gellanilyticum]|uniref:Putative ABC transport system permease protein n=1 Tax=Roseimicrobium gellanilyticum TaxID=748857 RepID=A0A366HSK0_9BACT|nr:ABC transporter permease [Roseimicrobium gellanilyticum]RBP46078.1 putative ABC transport system permease protein [Roseimicrobium gellanilyticum]
MNLLQQIVSVVGFSIRTIPARLGASTSAAIGIAGVVGTLVGVLSIAEGFRHAMTASGSEDVAIVMRSGADNEMTSNLTKDEARLISDTPGVARANDAPLASAELFVIIDLPKITTGTPANVPLRGVEPTAFDIRGNIQMVQGRRIEFGKNEIMVGAGAARAFGGLTVGNSLKIGVNTWEVVGIFTSGGGAAESELWTDAAVLQPAYNRPNAFQSVYVRLASVGSFSEFKDALTTNPQLKIKVHTLKEFYAEQSTATSDFITSIGKFIAGMMALGALFGALNTMYSAVSSRTREIATLRALGFGSLPVVMSVLAESLVLALAGGALGAGLAWLLFDGYQAATMNFQTFSQVSFAFAVTPTLLILAIIWASVLGLLGGIFPAIRAARLPIASALRET